MAEVVTIGDCTLILGRCEDVLPTLSGVDAVLTDPPYGIAHDGDYKRFTGGASKVRSTFDAIIGDDQPFDPSPWLKFGRCWLFGFNCFSDRLPLGSLLIWCKRGEAKLGKFMSDCEVAWMKGDHGVYFYSHIWDGFERESERRPSLHPTQKPVALMKWVMKKMRVPERDTVLDPYMGSGTTGVACVQTGRRFVGIECHRPYFDIAVQRIREAHHEVAGSLFSTSALSRANADLFTEVDE